MSLRFALAMVTAAFWTLKARFQWFQLGFSACSWMLLVIPSNAFEAGRNFSITATHAAKLAQLTLLTIGSERNAASCFCGKCGFRGRLHCFGDNVYGQCAVPIELASTKVVSIAAGFRHSCAVTAQGVLLCFGDNSSSVRAKVPSEKVSASLLSSKR